jgi:protocatechuate 3,4-dioxygenase beta subunit
LSGRLVDGDGEPARGVQLRIWVSGDGDYGKSLPGTATDAEGRFEHDGFLPGLAYTINAEGAKFEFATVATDLEVQPDESIDLGTIDVTSDVRPEPKRMAADQAQNATGAKSERLDDDVVEASGRVLASDGNAAAGAEVLFAPRYGATEADLKVRAITDADGRFTFMFPRSDLARLAEGLRPPWSSPYIVARMAGSGPVRKHIVEPADAKDVALQLVDDDVPIEGRIVDLEGQPVANAVLRVLRVEGRPNGNLDSWLQGLRNFGEFWNSSDTWLEESISQDISGLPAEVTTDADGRFTLRGMGRERVVDFRLEGPRLESTEISVMSRNEGAVTVPLEKESPRLGTYVLYNATFTHSAAPSQRVEGVVRDVDSGEPIAGVTLYCEKRAGRDIHGRYAPEIKTDERGRYVLNGLPKGADNEIAVVPPPGAPYAPQNLVIDTSRGLETQTVDVDLKATALIAGRVTDEATGEPVAKARVEYFAAIANENLDAYPGFRDADDITTTTDADGRYEIVGLPGRGFLAIRAAGDEFAAGQMIDIDQNDYDVNPGRWRRMLFRTHPHTCIAEQHHAVAAVDIPTDKTDVTRDVPLSRGITRRARILDPGGNPLVGVQVNRRGVYACEWYGGEVTLDDAEFTVYGLDRGKPRSLFLKHAARDFVGAFVVTADAEEPIEMRLQPAGALVGRVVDEDEKPVAHATLHGKLADGQGELDGFYFRASTDEAGRFRAAGLVPELKYQLQFHRSENEYVLLKPKDAQTADLTVSSGQVVELGDLQAFVPPATENRRRPKQAELSEQKSVLQSEKASASSRRLTIRGQITGPDGKPAAGAHVAVVASSLRQQRGGELGRDDEVLAEATTDSEGQYEIALNGVSSKTHRFAALIARAAGLALSWHRLNLDETGADVSLQLVGEAPLRGRFVDIEGRPAGGVRMHYRAVMPAAKDGKFEDGVGFREFNTHPVAWPESVTSDGEGRFTLPAIAAGHGVFLTAEASDRFAPQDIALNTGLPEQRGERDGTYRSQVVRNLKPGEEPVLALAPAQIFEGIVTYEDTGAPAPHARLTIWASQQKIGSMYSVPGKADAEGRYRIHPYPGIRFGITAYPPDGAPYLTREMPPVDWEDAATVKKVDVTLPRGVLVRGKVVEAGTDRPVAKATIQYVPEETNNPNDADDILTGWQGIQISNEGGEFEIVVLPGPGTLLVHGPNGEFILQESSSSQLDRGTPGGQRKYAHAFERIEPQAGGDPLEAKIELQPAKKVAGQIIDERGAPVDEALMITRLHITPQSPFWRGFPVEVLGGKFELGGLAPGQQYPTHFLDPKRRLGATVVLKAGDEEPTIVLKPCGQATARFVNPQGQPHDRFGPMLEMIVSPGGHKYDFDAVKRGELAADSDYVSNIDRVNHWPGPQTDEQGRVTFPALIPGATYRLGRLDGGNWSVAKEFSVGPGESLDLGDIVIQLND